MIEELFEKIKDYKYVSFDLFDTLMYRVVSKPEFIFDLVEREYNKNNERKITKFKKKRIHAEAIARKKAYYNEISIDDIYKELRCPTIVCNQLKKIEKDIEVETCKPNNIMVEVLNKCRLRGQIVIITTDMYLDYDTIKRILFHIGVKSDYIFLSSKEKKTKLSGELFKYILDKLDISPQEMCHIGDNKKTDILSPLRYGIQSFERVIRCNPLVLYQDSEKSLDLDILNTFIRHHLNYKVDKNNEEQVARIGYSIVGPLLYDFCNWIHSVVNKEKAECIAFVAREGYLIKKIYDEIFPNDNTRYIKLNKNMIRLPFLYKNCNIEDFLKLIPYRDKYTSEELARLLFCDESLISDILLENGVTNNYIYRKEIKSSSFKNIFDQIMNIESEKLEEQYNFLIEYLRQEDILDKKTLLVNNSINGSVQKSLYELFTNGEASNVIGCQFSASKKCCEELGNFVTAWMIDIKIPEYERQTFAQYSILLEHLMFEIAGTAMYLCKTENGVEVKCDFAGNELENIDVVKSIQKYALQFVRDWNKDSVIHFENGKVGIQQYMQFLLNPRKDDAMLIGDIVDEDYDGVHKLFDSSKKMSYKQAKKYENVKWQHGYFVTLKNGLYIKRLYDIEKRGKIFLKNVYKRISVICKYR